jgi:ribulose kinase
LKQTVAKSNGAEIYSLSFDATCSLVIIEEEKKDIDTIMWMDHRSEASASDLSTFLKLKYPNILSRFGETVSPESSLAKVCFLKGKRGKYFELPDYLSYRASGVETRSRNSLAAKWGFGPDGWDYSFWREYLNLDKDSVDSMFGGREVSQVGECIGYLMPEIVEEIGLPNGSRICVASSMIDAYAGAIATIGMGGFEIDEKIAVVAGLSGANHRDFELSFILESIRNQATGDLGTISIMFNSWVSYA